MKYNELTFWIWFAIWPVFLVWELALLWMRNKGMDVRTISMEARQHAYQLNVIPFIWASMASHWWLNWARPYQVPYPAIAFWLLVVGTMILDAYFWKTPYSALTGFLRVYRWPGTQVILGLLFGLLLFPQRDNYNP